MSAPIPVAPGVYLVRDTCNVYVVLSDDGADDGPDHGAGGGRSAIAIDFGSGEVLDHLAAMGVERLTDVLMTHHHRDQGQGLPRAVRAGVQIHVPPVERDLFDAVDEMWAMRPVANDYALRQDRFSLLEPVRVDGVVPEYRTATYGAVRVQVVPTPGHTTGSVTYLVERGGQRLAFTGDLIHAPGKVWSLAATQWSYSDNEGPAMTVLSCHLLRRERPDVLLPSHGEPMTDADGALALLGERMQRYVDSRRLRPWDLAGLLADPFEEITPHLLRNRSSVATSYVLLSDDGAALVIDYGYDMTTGLPPGSDRAARRPWLASLPALRARGVERVEVALATHYHDDHVAGLNLLRDVEGTQVWLPETVAPVLADPWRRDLPCLWHDPVRADRVLALGETVRWREHAITVHALRGHTPYQAAYSFEVDGVRVLATGDQQEGLGAPGGPSELLNYQYRNGFGVDDFVESAALYRRVAPGLMLSGHWAPRRVDDAYLELLEQAGAEVAALHRDLLPLDDMDLGTDGVVARLEPYRSRVAAGATLRLAATVRNPHAVPAAVVVDVVVPRGWSAEPAWVELKLEPGAAGEVAVDVVVGGPARRARVAVDVTVGELRLGQHAEALVDVVGRDVVDVVDAEGAR